MAHVITSFSYTYVRRVTATSKNVAGHVSNALQLKSHACRIVSWTVALQLSQKLSYANGTLAGVGSAVKRDFHAMFPASRISSGVSMM